MKRDGWPSERWPGGIQQHPGKPTDHMPNKSWPPVAPSVPSSERALANKQTQMPV